MPAGGGKVELLWAPGGTHSEPCYFQSLTQWLTANPGWSEIVWSITPIGPVAGRFVGGSIVVPTSVPGARVEAAVAAWSGNAASFDSAWLGGHSRQSLSPSRSWLATPRQRHPASPQWSPDPAASRGSTWRYQNLKCYCSHCWVARSPACGASAGN